MYRNIRPFVQKSASSNESEANACSLHTTIPMAGGDEDAYGMDFQENYPFLHLHLASDKAISASSSVRCELNMQPQTKAQTFNSAKELLLFSFLVCFISCYSPPDYIS